MKTPGHKKASQNGRPSADEGTRVLLKIGRLHICWNGVETELSEKIVSTTALGAESRNQVVDQSGIQSFPMSAFVVSHKREIHIDEAKIGELRAERTAQINLFHSLPFASLLHFLCVCLFVSINDLLIGSRCVGTIRDARHAFIVCYPFFTIPIWS